MCTQEEASGASVDQEPLDEERKPDKKKKKSEKKKSSKKVRVVLADAFMQGSNNMLPSIVMPGSCSMRLGIKEALKE